jgi:hypothetical protein
VSARELSRVEGWRVSRDVVRQVVSVGVFVGAVGMLAIGASSVLAVGARRATGSAWPALPPGFAPTVGAALSGICAIALLGTGLGQLATRDSNGVGGSLSEGLLAATVFVGFAVALWRTMRPPAPSLG